LPLAEDNRDILDSITLAVVVEVVVVATATDELTVCAVEIFSNLLITVGL